MRQQQPSAAQVRQLSPLGQHTVPEDWQDYNGHVNVRHYMTLYEIAGWPMFSLLGIDEDYFSERRLGIFDLEHHIYYLNELHVGDRVSLYGRFIARSAKRLHGMMFVVNDSRDLLSSSLEYVSSGANLEKRRTEAFPEDIGARIDELIGESDQLSWRAPICGAISA